MNSSSLELYRGLADWLLRRGLRSVRAGEWNGLGAGALCAESCSDHEKAAEILQRLGVLRPGQDSGTVWGPFDLVLPPDRLDALEAMRIGGPSLDELLAGFVGMCAFLVGVERVIPTPDLEYCYVDAKLQGLLIESGYMSVDLEWTEAIGSALAMAKLIAPEELIIGGWRGSRPSPR